MGETIITGIGQGYVLSTPLQLAVMAARIANGGRAIVPRIVRDATLASKSVFRQAPVELGLQAAHVRVVQDGMCDVVNSVRGTARTAAIRIPGFEMAGKTGTSQVRRISRSERRSGVIRNEHLPWEKRDHALFIGYAPATRPRWAIAVIIEHGGAGSKAAAPVARDILIAAQRLDTSRLATNGAGVPPPQGAPG
jgi:penicillin-binding protein 2